VKTDEHDLGALGSYVLGALGGDDRRSVEEHLARCPQCRAEQVGLAEVPAVLAELPPEVLLDGPPDGGELVLQRVLRQVRAESTRQTLRGRIQTGAVAAVVVAVALAGGLLLGRGQGRQPAAVAPAAPAAQPAGTKVASRTDPATGARLTVRVTPAAGWVRVTAAVTGIPAGQRCRLWVLGRDGTKELAGSWLVSEKGARDGTKLDGSALVTPQDVAAVQVANAGGREFVTVRV
jgi:RNA polymerase sigma-70 factor (ECF subfamily)